MMCPTYMCVVTCAAVASHTIVIGETLSIPQTCVALRIGPDMLTACGFSEAETIAALARLDQAVTERQATASAQAALQQAILQLEVSLQCETPSDPAVVESARQQVAAAQAALETARQSLWACFVRDCPAFTVTLLEAWTSNSESSLPPELRVVAWTASQRATLERALVSERRSQVTGRLVPATLATALGSARARQEVAQALAWRASRLPAVEDAFQNYGSGM